MRISDAELDVMKVIWEKNDKITSHEIIHTLKNNGKTWNDNTIRTLINRLIKKKAIGIVEKNGKTYILTSLLTESEYKSKRTKQFINQLFEGSFTDFVYCLSEGNKSELKEIHKILEKELKKYDI